MTPPLASAAARERGRELRTELRAELRFRFKSFLETVARATEAALLVDYDGTLAPFSIERDQASPYPGIALALQEIARHGRTRLAVISGRDASEVLALLNIHPPPEVWGLHGLQRLKTDGSIELQRLDPRTREGLADAERWLDYQQLRGNAEFKTGSVAMHWRGLTEDSAEDIRARVMLGWRLITKYAGLDLLEFDGGVEIRAGQCDKGDAVRTFLNEIDAETPVAYLGDDSTDEAAFRAINGRGISVLVRSTWRRTAAQLWLKPPEELLEFLGLWLKARVERHVFEGGEAARVNG
jgi:trehalose 6-phosphate phosphatase